MKESITEFLDQKVFIACFGTITIFGLKDGSLWLESSATGEGTQVSREKFGHEINDLFEYLM